MPDCPVCEQSGVITMVNNPDCYVCGDEIEPGEARDPVVRGRKSHTRHTPSGTPDTILAQLSGADKFQMYVDDRWVEASVEGINHCERVWFAKVTENYDGMPVSFSTPSKYSGDYEIRCERSGSDWGEMRLVELEHKWEEIGERELGREGQIRSLGTGERCRNSEVISLIRNTWFRKIQLVKKPLQRTA